MKIHAISDLHSCPSIPFPKLPGGDILIIAGDCTGNDSIKQWEAWELWLFGGPVHRYKYIVMIAGNHDGYLASHEGRRWVDKLSPEVLYIEDELIHLTVGEELVSIYGSPWTPIYGNWDFMLNPKDIRDKWDKIPSGLDILVTHGPPRGVLDEVEDPATGDDTIWTRKVGCPELLKAIERTKPKHHIFGHIHEHGGEKYLLKHGEDDTYFYNVAYVDEHYKPKNGYREIVI